MKRDSLGDPPSYTAKIVKLNSELLFDFSHLDDHHLEHNFERLVQDWCEQHESVAKMCSAFILRLPGGQMKNFVPGIQPAGVLQ